MKTYYQRNKKRLQEISRKYAREHQAERKAYLNRPDIKEKIKKYQENYFQNKRKAWRKTAEGRKKRYKSYRKSADKKMAWTLLLKAETGELTKDELKSAKKLVKKYKTGENFSSDETYNVWRGLGEI